MRGAQVVPEHFGEVSACLRSFRAGWTSKPPFAYGNAYTHYLSEGLLLNPQEQIPLALRAAYLTLHRQSDAAFAPYGVTADQFVLLATLSEGEALTQKELAMRMPSDPSTVRAMLVLLEERGLVRRDAHPTDGRARTAALTPAGRRKFHQLWNAGESIRVQMVSDISTEDANTLVRFLKQVAESLTMNSDVAAR